VLWVLLSSAGSRSYLSQLEKGVYYVSIKVIGKLAKLRARPAPTTLNRRYCSRKVDGLASDPDHERRETERLAREAIRLGKDDAFSLSWAGFSLAMVVGELVVREEP
jgi:transcriptional regulator with XRE-family HTH domain